MFTRLLGLWGVFALVEFASQAAHTQEKANEGPANLNAAWAELASSDAKLAYQAIIMMIAQPKETVTLMSTKLQPIAQVDTALIDQLVADLDSDDTTKHQKATKALEKLGSEARPALEKILVNPPSKEARIRAKNLLDRLDGPLTTAED
jgi:hypothetical protein